MEWGGGDQTALQLMKEGGTKISRHLQDLSNFTEIGLYTSNIDI